MAIKLVVTQAFGNYAKGDEITDADTVAEIQADFAAHVVKVAYEPDQAKPAKGSKPAPDADA